MMRSVKFSAGGEGAGGKADDPNAGKLPSLDEYVAANPDLKKRLEAGDAAVAALQDAEKKDAEKRGDLQKLLDTTGKERDNERTARETAEHRAKRAERRLELRDYVEANAEKLGVPARAVIEHAEAIDDGKVKLEELVNRTVEKVKAWGVQAKPPTDPLDGGGGGGGSTGGAGDEAAITELVKLGKAARKSGAERDLALYNKKKAELVAKGVTLPRDLPQRIAADG